MTIWISCATLPKDTVSSTTFPMIFLNIKHKIDVILMRYSVIKDCHKLSISSLQNLILLPLRFFRILELIVFLFFCWALCISSTSATLPSQVLTELPANRGWVTVRCMHYHWAIPLPFWSCCHNFDQKHIYSAMISQVRFVLLCYSSPSHDAASYILSLYSLLNSASSFSVN